MDNNQASVQEMIRNSLSDLGFAEMILRSLNEPGLAEGQTFNLTGYEDEDEDLSFEEEDDPITNPYRVDFMCFFNLNPDEDPRVQAWRGPDEDYWLSLDVLVPGDDAIWSDNLMTVGAGW